MKTVTVVMADDNTLKVFEFPENARNFAFDWWKNELGKGREDVDSEAFFDEVNEKVIESEENPWGGYLSIIEIEVI